MQDEIKRSVGFRKKKGSGLKDVAALRRPEKVGYRCPICARWVKTLCEFWQHIERHGG